MRNFLFIIVGKRQVTFSLVIFLIWLATFPAWLRADEIKPVRAPINKNFIYYQTQSSKVLHYTEEGYPLGVIPSIHDLSYLRFRKVVKAAFMPSSYDLRQLNKLTPIRNQGSCGPAGLLPLMVRWNLF
jgi:Papain family cysteine protease.